MPSDGKRTEAQECAAASFRSEAYWASPRRRMSDAGLTRRYIEMRNAWVAYHAGAPWMFSLDPDLVAQLASHRERFQAMDDEIFDLRAEVRRRRDSQLDCARRLRLLSEQPSAGPKWITECVSDVEADVSRLRAEVERLTAERDEARLLANALRNWGLSEHILPWEVTDAE